ncbi:MAG: disulfide bond formation protein B [Alphaproteobacteria bacterium]
MTRSTGLYFLAFVSLCLLGGALLFQYVGGLFPCQLCVWQRYPHGVVIALGLLGAPFLKGRAQAWALALAALALLAGAAIAAFHVGVEQKWWEGLPGCVGEVPGQKPGTSLDDLLNQANKQPAPRCDEIPWQMFGISMAGYNFIISLAVGLFGLGVAVGRRRA